MRVKQQTDGYRITSGTRDPEAVARILRGLPEWFGIEEANRRYVETAHELPTYLAWSAVAKPSEPIGALLVTRHFPASAEIHLLAIDRAWHRRGVGGALLAALEADLAADGVRLLQAKTLGPSHPNEPYEATRRFYTRQGFLPLEEIQDLWPGNPCLIMVKVL